MANTVKTFVEGFHDKAAVEKMRYNRLGNTELLVSELSIGGGGLGGLYGDVDREQGIQAIELALRSGINLIDTAPWYGQGRSERFIGEALRDIPRRAFYMADKVGRYELQPENMFDFRPARVRSSVEHSLRLLGLETLDLLQVHDLEFCADLETVISETLPALDELRQQGLVRCIGVTGYPVSTLKEVVRRSKIKIDSILSYSRNNLHDDTLASFIPFFQERNVGVIDAGATSMGLLSPVGPPAWHLASERLKQTSEEMRQLCKSRGHDLTRLALHYFLTRPGVTSHLMGVTSPEQVRQNLEMSREPISDQERLLLQEVLQRFASLPVEHRSWEGVEIDAYWKAINKAKADTEIKI